MALRQKIWVDGKIQGIIVGRILIYWSATMMFFGLGLAVTQVCDHPNWSYSEHISNWLATAIPWAPSIFLLLPLVVYDLVRTTHAFTGPINRVRQQLAKMAQNPNCTPLMLREDDYLHELIVPLNSLQHQIISLHMAIQKQRDTIEELREEIKHAQESENSRSGSRNAFVAQILKADPDLAESVEAITSAS